MNITKDTAVTLAYKLTTPQGKPLDAGTTAYLHGGYGNLFAKVEAALEGQGVGHSVSIASFFVPTFADDFAILDQHTADPRIGRGRPQPALGQLQGAGPSGQPQVFNVIRIKGPEVHLDGNHALAGQALRFAAKVTAVRAATAEEIAHGHVHGAHGHHH